VDIIKIVLLKVKFIMDINQVGNITFIGAGRMATAIAGGLIQSGMAKDAIAAYDISEAAGQNFYGATGIKVELDIKHAVSNANVVIIAVKPQSMDAALPPIAEYINDKLLISIAAGVTIEKLQKLSSCSRIVRVMPNTPALVGEGVSAYALGPGSIDSDAEVTEMILGATGSFCAVSEPQLDAVTGLSGSGPAYVFSFIQALSDGGVQAGLPRDTASKLAAQTVLGAAKMVIDTNEHPAVLCDQVTSPGGTTAAGLSVLSNRAFKGTVSSAVVAATERSIELGRK